MPDTKTEIDRERQAVDELRRKIEKERAAAATAQAVASEEYTLSTLRNERVRLEEELAALRGEDYARSLPTVNTADGAYEVPMGTVSVDTDKVVVGGEVDNVPAPPAPPVFDGFAADDVTADDGDN